ncbi:hypothetical protein EXE43_07755 [Halorubrum sp. SS5]|nr:hypothetical protein EXE43_07755 [Halorubrum sp. SS5]
MSEESDAGTPSQSAVRQAARESRLGSLWRRTAEAVRSSYLYRWLTAEPDPEVIVIDLRETWTVGPFIRLLDAILDRVVPAIEDSRIVTAARAGASYTLAAPMVVAGLAVLTGGLLLALVSVAGGTLGTTRLGLAAGLVIAGVIATRERRSWAALRETRPVALLIAALEPPAPPAESDSEPASGDDTQTTAATSSDDSASDPTEKRH